MSLQTINSFGYNIPRIVASTLLGVPDDTFAVPAELQTIPFFAIKNGDLWLWNTVTFVWEQVAAGGGSNIYTADGTIADALRTVTLGGNVVNFDSALGTHLGIAEAQTYIAARDVTAGGNTGIVTTSVSSVVGTVNIQALFDNVAQQAQIQLQAQSGGSLIDFTAGSFNFNGNIGTSLISDTDNTDDLGSSAIAWKDIYARRLLLDGSTSGTATILSDALANALNSTTLSGTGYTPSTMFSRLTSNSPMLDQNTVQPVFGSTQDVWTLQGSTAYAFEGVYYLTHGAVSHSVGLSFELAGGASLTSIFYTTICWVTVANTNTASQTTNLIIQATNTAVNAAGANAQEAIRFFGVINVNAGGTVTPSVTFSSAPGGAPAAVAGTYISFTPIGTNVITKLGNVA